MYDLHDPVGITALHFRALFASLPPSYRPARVRRYGTVTVVAVDPRSTRRELAEWAVDNLTVEEHNEAAPPTGSRRWASLSATSG
jgi:hypothetical protein